MTDQSVKHLFQAVPDRQSPFPAAFAGVSPEDWNDWRWHMRNQITGLAELQELLSAEALAEAAAWFREPGAQEFRFAVTPYYVALSRFLAPPETLESPAFNRNSGQGCPILAQVLPQTVELADPVYDLPDPLAEETHMPVRGLTHRYPDRALWYLTHRCAVYCRYCLRKRKVSAADTAPNAHEREAALNYIRENPQIREVILSGGDPLALSDAKLDSLLGDLRAIPHLSSLRIHTRMPVTLPFRITDELCAVLRRHFPITLVTHFNHVREVSADARAAIRRLRMAGVSVLNQSVLLSSINDTLEDQRGLLLALVEAGVVPYYLHRCDEVRGVSHFRAPLERGLEIIRGLRGTLSGFAIPRYVVDLPGGGGKIALEPEYLVDKRRSADGKLVYTFSNGAGKKYRVHE